jgi:hypothetical protein
MDARYRQVVSSQWRTSRNGTLNTMVVYKPFEFFFFSSLSFLRLCSDLQRTVVTIGGFITSTQYSKLCQIIFQLSA